MTTLDMPVSPEPSFHPESSPVRPVALLIEPSVGVSGSVAGLLALQGYDVAVAKGLTDDVHTATLVLVEADRGARAIGLIKCIRALRPELPIAGVLPWWDDDEREIVGIVQFVLHVPVRDDQLRGLAALAASALSQPVAS